MTSVATAKKERALGDQVKYRGSLSTLDDLHYLESGADPEHTAGNATASSSHMIDTPEKKLQIGAGLRGLKLAKKEHVLPLLILIWYGSASVAITSSKRTMMLPMPFLLCVSQFAVASVMVGLYARYTRSLKPLHSSTRVTVFQISVSYTLGFIFTNVAFSLGQ
jgi:hypothetical protein